MPIGRMWSFPGAARRWQIRNEMNAWNAASEPVGSARRLALVRVTHFGAVRQRDPHELPAVAAVAQRMDGELDVHAGHQRLGGPTLAGDLARAAHLDSPLLE